AAAADFDGGDVFERNAQPARSLDENSADRTDVAPLVLPEAHGHRIFPFALPNLSGLFSAESCFDHILNIHDVQAVAGRPLAVDFDLQLRNLAGAIHESSRDARNFLNRIDNLLG